MVLVHKSVSVVVTCHNLEKYIGAAIKSVLNQDYPGQMDVIVIDDCSTDQSADIIKSYGTIRYLRPEKNLGVLMATVLGLENSTGELVFFLDGDDVWESTKLSAAVELFSADPQLALVTHDLKYIDSSGHLLDRKSRAEEVMAAVPTALYDSMTRDGILLHSDYVWLGSAYAVHRTLGKLKDFCTFAKTLPDPFNTYQDWPLAFWVACQPQVRFGYVPCKLFHYRLHGANHSGDATSVQKAVRNFRRSRNTMDAIDKIAASFEVGMRVKKVTQQKLAFYSYLVDLYSGYRWRSAKGFLINLPYLIGDTSSFLKEAIRFGGMQIFGVERFIGLVSAKRAKVND